MKFQNLKIGVKLWLLFGFFLMVILTFAGSSFYLSNELSTTMNNLSRVQLPATRTITLIDMMHDGLHASVATAFVAHDEKNPADLEESYKDTQEHSQEMIESLNKIKDLPLGQAIREDVDKVFPIVQKYTEMSLLVVGHIRRGDLNSAIKSREEFEVIFKKLEENLESLGHKVLASAEQKQKKSDDLTQFALIMNILVTICSIVFGFTLFSIFIRSIVSRITPVMQMVQSIGQAN